MYRNRIAEHLVIDSSELRRNPLNHRRHPDSQRHALRQLLGSVGIVDELLAYRDPEHGLTLVDGEARWSEGGSWPVAVLDLTPDEARLALAMLDQIGSQAEIDPEALLALLDSLPAQARQTAGAAWSDDELAALLGEPAIEPGAGGDDFDTTPDDGPTRTSVGELWQIGPHRLLVGDCTDPANVARLMGGERAQAMVSDSPYGISQEGIENDDPEGLRALFDGMLTVLPLDNGVVVNFQSTRLFPVWLDALRAAGQKFERMLWLYKAAQNTYPWRGWLLKSEAILVSTKGSGGWNDHHPYAHDCYYLSEVSGEIPEGLGWHASVKPMSVVTDLYQRVSSPDGIVYDPFSGSGTGIIAAHRTGRRCYSMEIAPRYADVILRRAEAEGLECVRASA